MIKYMCVCMGRAERQGLGVGWEFRATPAVPYREADDATLLLWISSRDKSRSVVRRVSFRPRRCCLCGPDIDGDSVSSRPRSGDFDLLGPVLWRLTRPSLALVPMFPIDRGVIESSCLLLPLPLSRRIPFPSRPGPSHPVSPQTHRRIHVFHQRLISQLLSFNHRS